MITTKIMIEIKKEKKKEEEEYIAIFRWEKHVWIMNIIDYRSSDHSFLIFIKAKLNYYIYIEILYNNNRKETL